MRRGRSNNCGSGGGSAAALALAAAVLGLTKSDLVDGAFLLKSISLL